MIFKVIQIACLQFLFAINLLAMDNNMHYQKIKDVPKVNWEALAGKTIFFGHQSVGNNIIDGMINVMEKYPFIKLNIVNNYDKDILNQPVFTHIKIGVNRKPLTKIFNFYDIVAEQIGSGTDYASMKLCYVDITNNTNVNNIFQVYKKKVSEIESKHPAINIIHFTVPLTVSKKTWKTYLKLLLGKEPWELADNVKRNNYNNFLRDEYGKAGFLFDLALFESTKPDGTEQLFNYKGKKYASLYPEYSSDGEHLNTTGSQVIAEKFFIFLATRSR